MSTELRPLGVRCNLACAYCYQAPTRSTGPEPAQYDLDAMLRTAEAIDQPITIFGGEPLMMPIHDLERLFQFGLTQFGGSSIQTNGVLVTPEHIDLFRRYSVHVGISIDGPGRLNELRWAHSPARTSDATYASLRALEALVAAGLCPSVIVTLHRANAAGERLRELVDWMLDLDALGIKFVRIHLLESEAEEIRERFGLSTEEAIEALMAIRDMEGTLKSVRFDVFEDVRAALTVESAGAETCIWNACDPYTTPAVQGIEGNGARSNCGRTNKDGVEFVKAERTSYERYLALFHTPQEFGGCHGCRFFLSCQGQCPGTAIDGDWRNRSEHCAVWFALFELAERELVTAGVTPISLRRDRGDLELAAIRSWDARRPVRSVIHSQGAGRNAVA